MMRHCHECNSQRKGDVCQKCGSETTEVNPEWDYPELPPIDKIRELAREVGYAIGVHGTLERDLDLIAAPWTDTAIGNYGLMQHIANGLVVDGHPARIIETERKPLGRYAASIQMFGWYKCIDLSVCPQLKHQMSTEELETLGRMAGHDAAMAYHYRLKYEGLKKEVERLADLLESATR